MTHIRSIAISLTVAVMALFCSSIASSQLDIHVKTASHHRRHVVHHPRTRVHVRLQVADHHRVEHRRYERRGYPHQVAERHDNR